MGQRVKWRSYVNNQGSPLPSSNRTMTRTLQNPKEYEITKEKGRMDRERCSTP